MEAEINTAAEARVKEAQAKLGEILLGRMLDEIRAMPDSWQVLSELQQQEVLDRLIAGIDNAVAQAIMILAAGQFATIKATVDKVVFTDDVTAALTLQKDSPYRHDLADAAGSDVIIVLEDVKNYTASARNVKPDPDQPELKDVKTGRLALERTERQE